LRNCRSCFEAAGQECSVDSLSHWSGDLIVDALIGHGLCGPPTGATAGLIAWANAAGVPIVSLDIASGPDAATDQARRGAILPALTRYSS